MSIWTVTELCQYIKLLLDGDELLRICAVKGEISNTSFSPAGHLYLTLKDGTSQIAGVMFHEIARRLKFKPEDGMKVLAFGRVSIYPGRSQYQILLQDLQPEGLGELYAAFVQLKEKLEKEGLFDPARKKSLPFFPKTVGIITSLQGAAIHDMLTIMGRRNPCVRIIVAPSQVQGDEAPRSLIAALRKFREIPEIEIVILGRGGGSLEELWAFNDETLAREIAAYPVPVVSAVGHETDFTIADFVADLRAPTPSAAAELIVPLRENLIQNLAHLYGRLRLSLTRGIERDRKALDSLTSRPVFRFPLERVQRESQTLDHLFRRLTGAFSDFIKLREAGLSNLIHKLDGLSPRQILKRGYAAVVKGKKLLKSAREAEAARRFELIFHDGRVPAAVSSGRKKNAEQRGNNLQESFVFPP